MSRVPQIDPGHGGANQGARGHGIIEEDYTLMMARMVSVKCNELGLPHRLTRTTDTTVLYGERAKHTGSNAVWCLHNNASKSKRARGFHVYVLPGDKVGRMAAERLIDALPKEVGKVRIIEAKRSMGSWIERPRYLLNVYRGPVVLVEMLFVSNPKDAALLEDKKIQNGIADAIVESMWRWTHGTL